MKSLHKAGKAVFLLLLSGCQRTACLDQVYNAQSSHEGDLDVMDVCVVPIDNYFSRSENHLQFSTTKTLHGDQGHITHLRLFAGDFFSYHREKKL